MRPVRSWAAITALPSATDCIHLGVRRLDLRRLLRCPRAWAEILRVLPVLRPGTKVRLGRLKVEVRVEQRVVGNVPKPVRIICVYPETFGTQVDNLAEHR